MNSANAASIRRELGVCPQQNVVYNEMTAAEHLAFVAEIKGPLWIARRDPTVQGLLRSGTSSSAPSQTEQESLNDSVLKAIESEIQLRLEQVGLQSSEDGYTKLVGEFSGGMKRKLCIAMALMGGPEVLTIDEGTSGVDPASKRELWDLIQREKEGRVVLITTHAMDEAEQLSNRVNILRRGRLFAAGRPLFLRVNPRFSKGFRLVVSLPDSKCGFDWAALDSVVRQHIAGMQVEAPREHHARHETKGRQYVLPFNAVGELPSLFENLERAPCIGENGDNADFGLPAGSEISLQHTSLEEVFVRISSKLEQVELPSMASATPPSAGPESRKAANSDTSEKPAAPPALRHVEPDLAVSRQWLAMLYIRYLRTIAQAELMFWLIIFPIVMLLVGIVMLWLLASSTEEPPSIAIDPAVSVGLSNPLQLAPMVNYSFSEQ